MTPRFLFRMAPAVDRRPVRRRCVPLACSRAAAVLLACAWLATPAHGSPDAKPATPGKTAGKPAAKPAGNAAFNPPERIRADRPTLAGLARRPLRYRPDGKDFVIENGKEFFNRSLYGGNTAFRVDAGDLPECMLFLPGRGGNLRLGLVAGADKDGKGGKAKWLCDADRVVARYRPGSMIYEIRDGATLAGRVLRVTAMATRDAEGLIVRVELLGASGDAPPDLFWAFGGNDGKKGSRGGDIGCEKQPVAQFFQLSPAGCEDNAISLREDAFKLTGKAGTLRGVASAPTRLAVANADRWSSATALLKSAGKNAARPVVLGRARLKVGQAYYLSIAKPRLTGTQPASNASALGAKAAVEPDALPALFDATERARAAVASRVVVETPDVHVNAVAAALCVAADAIWDEREGAVMHGAIAWRRKLLGWRGQYANDALGWHDRAERDFNYWAKQQNVEPVPATIPKADDASNLARDEAALKSNGAMSFSHYDMNLVAIDAMLRHLLWTGDMAFAKSQWPTIQRHLAWEQRLFRRPFGPDGKLPLYEAYAAIWASDDLEYEGGGTAHASAYNYYQNKMAARLAALIGKDPKPYQDEAGLILRAMRQELWLPALGRFAEWKDLLGERLAHPDAGAWTTYHVIDSEVPSALDAWQMAHDLVTRLPRIPIGDDAGDLSFGPCTIATTNWMPYQWSTNNVVVAESMHSALALWQAGTPEEAFNLFKGCVLDTMFMGLCPGNVGMTTGADAARGEAQRDFGDGIGAMSRALIEGLFGVRPDLLAGTLRVAPGLPDAWNSASIQHPDFNLSFKREIASEHEARETWTIEPKFKKPVALELIVPARHGDVASVMVDDKESAWDFEPNAVGFPRVRVKAPAAARHQVVIASMGNELTKPAAPQALAPGDVLKIDLKASMLKQVSDPQGALTGLKISEHGFEARVAPGSGPRVVFARVEQRDKLESLPFPLGYKVAKRPTWWAPIVFDEKPALEVLASRSERADGVHFRVGGAGLPAKEVRAPAFVSDGARVTTGTALLFIASSKEDSVPASGLLPGTLRVRVMEEAKPGDKGKSPGGGKDASVKILAEGNVTDWMLNVPKDARLEPVNLTPFFNDRVTRIFENEYVAPRSPYPSLAIPKQGVGSWCNYQKTFDVDDRGLRRAAGKGGGRFALPNGVVFATPGPGTAKNVVFTSQWSNYPKEATIPISGKASRVYLLMAGSTNSMQSRFDNGEVVVTYADGSTDRLALRNPETWWPIDQDYFIDNRAFRDDGAIPPRVDLATGKARIENLSSFEGKGGVVPGGAATVLDLTLSSIKPLKSLRVHAIANEVVVGLMAATLAR